MDAISCLHSPEVQQGRVKDVGPRLSGLADGFLALPLTFAYAISKVCSSSVMQAAKRVPDGSYV